MITFLTGMATLAVSGSNKPFELQVMVSFRLLRGAVPC
jgi:hypothetical protein